MMLRLPKSAKPGCAGQAGGRTTSPFSFTHFALRNDRGTRKKAPAASFILSNSSCLHLTTIGTGSCWHCLLSASPAAPGLRMDTLETSKSLDKGYTRGSCGAQGGEEESTEWPSNP